MALPGPGDHAAIRGIISDLDGVLYRGDQPIPDSVKAFQAWHTRGVPYAFVTNNAAMSAEQFATKLESMGVPTNAAQVFNSISATVSLMQQRWTPRTRVFAIGEPPLFQAIEAGGFTLAGEDAEIVVLGFDYALTYDKLRTAVRAALNGAAIVVTNPDMLTPADDGFEPCVGVLAAAVSAAVPSAVPIVVGKPQPFMVEQALALVATKKSETIMIGDQIATDIVAGQRAGLRSFLLTTGLPQAAIAGATPDRVIGSLLDIVDEVTAG